MKISDIRLNQKVYWVFSTTLGGYWSATTDIKLSIQSGFVDLITAHEIQVAPEGNEFRDTWGKSKSFRPVENEVPELYPSLEEAKMGLRETYKKIMDNAQKEIDLATSCFQREMLRSE